MDNRTAEYLEWARSNEVAAPAEHGVWLIERGNPARPEYLAVEDFRFSWTHELQSAIRFAREHDATMVASMVDGVRIKEHFFDEDQA